MLLLVMLVAACGRVSKPERHFDSASWRSAGPEERGLMCRDLMRKHALVGMQLDEVRSLLGEPQLDNQSIAYRLGVVDDPCCPSCGRLTILLSDGKVSQIYGLREREAGQPSVALAFEPSRFRQASADERLAMLDGALALKDELLGHPIADVEAIFGPPDEQSHDVTYTLSRDEKDFLTGCFQQRLLSLKVDRRGVVTKSVDHEDHD